MVWEDGEGDLSSYPIPYAMRHAEMTNRLFAAFAAMKFAVFMEAVRILAKAQAIASIR